MNPSTTPRPPSETDQNRPSLFSTSGSSRWCWMAGSAAAAAASANAGTVQISQINNLINSSSDLLRSDFTDDTNSNAVLTGVANSFDSTFTSSGFNFSTSGYFARLLVNASNAASAKVRKLVKRTGGSAFVSSSTAYLAFAGNQGNETSASSSTPTSINGLVPLMFTDARINSDTATSGFLDIRSFNTSYNSHTVQIVRLVFDDASTTAPGGVTAGGNNANWVAPTTPPTTTPTTTANPNAALKASLLNKIKKLKKKAKVAKAKGKKAKAKKLQKKAKSLTGIALGL